MLIEVDLGTWEHLCCGDAVARDEPVSMDCLIPADGEPALVLHGGLDPLPWQVVRGQAVELEHLTDAGGRVRVDRVPSGRELLDADIAGERVEIVSVADGAPHVVHGGWFVVTVNGSATVQDGPHPGEA